MQLSYSSVFCRSIVSFAAVLAIVLAGGQASAVPKVGEVVINAQSPASVVAGNVATFPVTVNRGTGGGSSGNMDVEMIITGLPAGVNGTFLPDPIAFNPGDNSKVTQLTITTPVCLPTGNYPFTVRAEKNDQSFDFATANSLLVVTGTGSGGPTCNVNGPSPVCPVTTGLSYTATTNAATPSYAWSILGNGTINGSATNSSVSVNSTGVGAFTISVLITDTSTGCNTTCQQIVTVGDNTPPTITCPANVSIGADLGQCTASGVALGTPTTGDNCSVASVTNNAPSTFPLGLTVVTWTVTDGAGNTATCQQNVTVSDNQNPTITCPANVSVNADNGQCSASGVVLGTPTTGDNCGVASVTNDAPLGSYPSGITTVTWTVTDNNGNTATCQQTVTVTDNQNPTITCPSNVTVNVDNGQCGASGVALGTPTTGDNCGVASVTNDAPLGSFPTGINTVTWTVTDNSGNTATCQQTVTVVDNEAPTITCPADVSVPSDIGLCTASGVALGTPTTADNCDVDTVTNDAPGTFPVGVTTVTWTVTDDSGNTATCEQSVTVTDSQVPTITCPVDVSVNADNGQCDASGVALGVPTTFDLCGVDSVVSDAPSSFPVGTTVVTWTVTDDGGNTATCTQNVTVTDNQNPTITCPGDVSVDADNGSCEASVSLGTPVTADNCSVLSVTNDAPGTYPVGQTTVTWTVTDVNGNTNTCTQNVTVTDNQNPTITCPADVAVNVDNGACEASNVDLGTPATGDNCGVDTVSNDAPLSFPVGQTLVSWTVTDVNGNTATCQQNVTVSDNQNPTITCPAPVSVNAALGQCGITSASVALSTPVTSDNCATATLTVNAPDVFPVGTTQIIWTVTDVNNNITTCAQNVTVVDNQNPSITCPVAVSVNASAGVCGNSSVTLGTPTTSDNCSVASVTNNAPGTFPVGLTVVTWTVTDTAGRTATCTQNVTVVDNQNPTITCPAAVSVNASAGVCGNSSVTLGTPTTSDNCSVASVTNNAPGTFPVGLTVVTWTVTDTAGRTATCTQNVTVTDNQNPTITCPAAVTVNSSPGECGNSSVALGTPTTSDNCSVASVTNNSPGTFPVGLTVVTWTVTDTAGRTATCNQNVTVSDNENPTITCPSDITVDAAPAASSAIVNYPSPTTSDNCGVDAVDGAPASGSSFPVGTTTVTYTVTDFSGNTNTCSFSVTVNAVNSAPVATPDTYTISEDTTLDVGATTGVLANDTDPQLDPLTAILVSGTSDGALTFNSDGSFTYVPDPNFNGTDTFTYKANDGTEDSNIVTVSITVEPIDGASDIDVYCKRVLFSLNRSTTASDVFSVRGKTNPSGANADLSGATMELSINGIPVAAPVALDASGKASVVVGDSIVKAQFASVSGLYKFAIARADLQAAFGLANVSESGLALVDVGIKIHNAGLDFPDVGAKLEIPYVTKQDVSTRGKFRFKPHRTMTGAFNFDKTTATQLPDGTFRITGRGHIEAEGGAPVLLKETFLLRIGASNVTAPAAGVKFWISNTPRRFNFTVNSVDASGIPLAGDGAPTVYKLPIQFELPTVDGTEFYESTIELKRPTATTTKWRR